MGVLQAVLRHVDFSQVKVVLLASPGFSKDDFFAFMNEEAVRKDDKVGDGGKRMLDEGLFV